MDVVIPRKISFARLRELVQEALAEMNVTLPNNYQLNLMDKSFKLGLSDKLSDFGFSNGDRIEILVGEVSEII